MKVSYILAGATLVEGQNNAGGIEKVQQLLGDLRDELNHEGAEAATLYEEQACTCKSAALADFR